MKLINLVLLTFMFLSILSRNSFATVNGEEEEFLRSFFVFVLLQIGLSVIVFQSLFLKFKNQIAEDRFKTLKLWLAFFFNSIVVAIIISIFEINNMLPLFVLVLIFLLIIFVIACWIITAKKGWLFSLILPTILIMISAGFFLVESIRNNKNEKKTTYFVSSPLETDLTELNNNVSAEKEREEIIIKGILPNEVPTHDYYVVYAKDVPFDDAVREFLSGKLANIKSISGYHGYSNDTFEYLSPVTTEQLSKYNIFLGNYDAFEGDGKPTLEYFRFRICVETSKEAKLIKKHYPGVHSEEDIDGYSLLGTGAWTIDFDKIFRSKQTIDAMIKEINDLGVKITKENYSITNVNEIIFFGTCLPENKATELKQLLNKQGIATKVLKLKYIEIDL